MYSRMTYSDHPPVIALVTAKTKVAKLEPPTVPSLELCGAVLLTKILTNAADVLGIPREHCNAWTDSAIVLAWLDGQPRQFPVYVANRVSLILQSTSPQIWKHVPTAENPANCASRGMMPKELLDHALWWRGPHWLSQEPIPVPKQPPRRTLITPELISIHIISTTSFIALQIGNISANYHITLAIAAWCLRFCNRIRHGRPEPDTRSKHLSGAEITQAEHWLLREAQTRSFFKEKKALEKGQVIPQSSRLLALTPLLDGENILRVGGRLSNSSLSRSQQHPIIGDSKDPLIIKLFKHMHLVLCHCGPSLLLCATGAKLHVVGARRLSRTVCSQYVICRRSAPKFQQQLMGVLPAPRVNPTIAFTHTGMDFAGPFQLKMGHTRRPVKIKAHICVFICLTYKAIHIEVVSDEITSAFLACFRRFATRRNCPQHLYSDNGPNFTGAKNQLNRLYKLLQQEENDTEIRHYLLEHHKITWHSIPPRSPHFGGLWESVVKSMKKHLNRFMGTLLFTFEELTTITCQVEACLNSRPILPITSHSQDGR